MKMRNNKEEKISRVIDILKEHFNNERRTTLNRMRGEEPFKVLMACLVSTSIKDEITEKIVNELFSKAHSFNDIIQIDDKELERILYLARFRRVKAKRLKEVSKEILERFGGSVPDNKEDLLSIKGIGPKTANIVLSFAYNKDFLPVDVNVHRIVNRLGLVNTKTPEKTESALNKIILKKYFKELNAIFMLHGKKICVPVSPFCSKCPVERYCNKVGVKKSR